MVPWIFGIGNNVSGCKLGAIYNLQSSIGIPIYDDRHSLSIEKRPSTLQLELSPYSMVWAIWSCARAPLRQVRRDEDGYVPPVKARPVHDGLGVEAPPVAVERRHSAKAAFEGHLGALN